LKGKIEVRGEDRTSYSGPGPGTTGRVRATTPRVPQWNVAQQHDLGQAVTGN
jgi:hypothetical protein